MKSIHDKRIDRKKFISKNGDRLKEVWINASEFSVEVGGLYRSTCFGALVRTSEGTYPFYI